MVENLLSSIRGFIIDMDGVVYEGERVLPGSREFVQEIRTQGIPFLMVTNNATLTSHDYVEKLRRMGIEVDEQNIMTSAQATAAYLEKIAPPGERMYAIGERGLLTELLRRGYSIVQDYDQVGFVVVGMDRGLTYEKLKGASLAIRRGARFIATNPDTTYPSEEGQVPGNGACLAALEAATGVKPTVIGKPQPAIFELSLSRLGLPASSVAVLGDRLETDILGGKRAGLKTILLLCGVTRPEEVAGSGTLPDLIFDDLGAFACAWRKAYT